MNDLVLPEQGSKELAAFEEYALTTEQPDCPVVHRFGPGIYIREVRIPAGSIVSGHHHKQPHMNIMLEGEMVLITPEGERMEVVAPMQMTTGAGKKIAHVLKDTVWLNVYATEERDIEKLEEMLFEKEDVFTNHVEEQATLEYHDEELDIVREDYLEVIDGLGFSAEEVRALTENEADQITFPDGAWAVAVQDSNIEGKGLFATATFSKGDLIAPGRIDSKRTPAGRFINHSPFANARAIMAPNGDVNVYALEDIEGMRGGMMGQEILMDYTDAFMTTRENT